VPAYSSGRAKQLKSHSDFTKYIAASAAAASARAATTLTEFISEHCCIRFDQLLTYYNELCTDSDDSSVSSARINNLLIGTGLQVS